MLDFASAWTPDQWDLGPRSGRARPSLDRALGDLACWAEEAARPRRAPAQPAPRAGAAPLPPERVRALAATLGDLGPWFEEAQERRGP